MTGTQLAIFVSAFLAMDLVIASGVLWFIAATLNDLAKAYPINAAAEGTWRHFQSISMDAINLGGGVHMRADEEWVHVAPTWALRRFGARPMSLPRAEMSEVRPAAIRMCRVRLGKRVLRLPKWTMERELAAAGAAQQTSGGA
jgi:hypothetical protein